MKKDTPEGCQPHPKQGRSPASLRHELLPAFAAFLLAFAVLFIVAQKDTEEAPTASSSPAVNEQQPRPVAAPAQGRSEIDYYPIARAEAVQHNVAQATEQAPAPKRFHLRLGWVATADAEGNIHVGLIDETLQLADVSSTRSVSSTFLSSSIFTMSSPLSPSVIASPASPDSTDQTADAVSTGWTGQANKNIPGDTVAPGSSTRNDNWTNASNWDAGGLPGGNTRNLFFGNGYVSAAGGNGSTTSNNDFVGYVGHRIFFESNAGAPTFTITGNSLTLFDFNDGNPALVFPKIENLNTKLNIFNLVSSSRTAQTITYNDGGGSNTGEIDPTNGSLLFSSSTLIAEAGSTQLKVFGGNTVTFNGVISGSNGFAISPGASQTPTVVFGAANTYSGDTIVNSGTLNFALGGSSDNSTIRLGNNSANTASVNLISPTGGQTIGSIINPGFNNATGTYSLSSTNYTGTNTLSATIFLDTNFTINAVNAGDSATQLTLGGGISFQNVTRTLTIGGAGNTTFSGSFTNVANGASSFLKTGNGTFTITGDQSGAGANLLKYQISAGTLSVGSALNLPTPNVNYPDKIQFNSSGTLQSTGTFTFGRFNNAGDQVGITLNGGGTTTANLAVTGANTFTINGVITGASANVAKADTGTLELTQSNTYTGATTVNGGTVKLDGANGAFGSTSAVTVNQNSTITLDNSANNNTNRINNTATVTLKGGTLNLSGNAGGATSETIAAFSVGANGGSVVTLTPNAAQATTLTGSTFTRTSGSEVLFRGTSLGATSAAGVANIKFTTAPTLSNTGTGTLNTTQVGVVRGAFADSSATGNGSTFATYDTTTVGSNGGIRPLNASEQLVDAVGGATYNGANTGDNVKITAAASITGKTTNTLQIDNTSGVAFVVTNTGAALNPQNGLMFTGTSGITLTGGTFVQGSTVDLVLYSSNSSAAGVTIATNLSEGNSAGIAVGGNGIISLNGQLNTAGQINFNNLGTTNIGASITAGTGGNGYSINNGTVKMATGGSFVGNRLLAIGNGATLDLNNIALSFGQLNNAVAGLTNTTPTTATVTNSGGTLTNFSIGNNGSSGTFNGTITGAINLVKGGNGTETLNNTSTYTGTTSINTGTLQNGVTNALPTGTALTIGNAAANATFDLAGFQQTVGSLASGFTTGTATVTNSGSTLSVLTVNGTTTTTYSGLIANGTGGVGLTKAGTGTLRLFANNGGVSTANTFAGQTIIQNGTLEAAGAGALGSTSAITVNNGGTLLISNAGNSSTDHVNNAAPITLAGGTIKTSGTQEGTYTGGVTPSATVGLGMLTLTANSTIDFNNVANGVLAFGYLVPGTFTLTINNYVFGSGTSGDHLVFTGDLLPFINNGTFIFNGLGGGPVSEIDLGNNLYELTPVPEPATWVAAAITLAVLSLSQRRRVQLLLKAKR